MYGYILCLPTGQLNHSAWDGSSESSVPVLDLEPTPLDPSVDYIKGIFLLNISYHSSKHSTGLPSTFKKL